MTNRPFNGMDTFTPCILFLLHVHSNRYKSLLWTRHKLPYSSLSTFWSQWQESSFIHRVTIAFVIQYRQTVANTSSILPWMYNSCRPHKRDAVQQIKEERCADCVISTFKGTWPFWNFETYRYQAKHGHLGWMLTLSIRMVIMPYSPHRFMRHVSTIICHCA
jgi:hypothetical protein